jgi:diketogulonate reductase-like aldo/keto reductase
MERDRAAAIVSLRRGIELGLTHIDTAEMYGSGAVEELIGEAIAGKRDQVVLVSKVLPQNASREGAVRACERSLKRLRTDRLDGYLLHWPSRHPLEETLAGFRQLRDAGKIRWCGVSNFDVGDLERAIKIERGIACNQVLYHLGERAIEHAVIPWCERLGIAVVGYSPFGSGRFPKSPVLDEIARAHDATPRQVALAFLTRRPSLFAIPKAAQVAHVEECAKAVKLSDAEISRIDRAFPVGRATELPTL